MLVRRSLGEGGNKPKTNPIQTQSCLAEALAKAETKPTCSERSRTYFKHIWIPASAGVACEAYAGYNSADF